MNNIQLKKAVIYSKNRAPLSNFTISNYITTDNILQNKKGIVNATNLPPNGTNISTFNHGHILVANIRPYLKKIWYADRSGGCSADVLNFQVNESFDSKFIYYNMFRDDFFIHMMKGSKGSKMPRGDKEQILNYIIPNYDLSTQKRISSILSSLDAKIELNNKINAELEAIAKTLFNYWFVQFDFPNSEGKPYKTSGGKMVWSEELKREIPDEWATIRLEKLGKFKNGINYDPSIKGDVEAKIINVRNISSSTWFVSQYELDTIVLPYSDVKNYLVTDKDIIIARSGIPGATRIMYEYAQNTIYCGFIIRYQVIDLKYKIYLFFCLKDLERSTTSKSTGTIMQNVNQETLNRMPLVLPKIKLIDEFNKLISPMFEKHNSNLKQNYQLSELRDWLLPMLMNGQVKVN